MIGLEFIVKKAGIKYKAVAEYLNISPKTVNDWVKNRSNIPKDRLKQLAELFGLEENLFQNKLTRVEELEVEINLFLRENHEIKTSDGTVFLENQEELDRLLRLLEIEKRQESILRKLRELVVDLSYRKWSISLRDQDNAYENWLEILISSTDNLLNVFQVDDADFNPRESEEHKKLIQAKKALMIRDMLYFVNNFFGIEEKKWSDINPYITDTQTESFDKQLALLQKQFYPVK